MGAFNTTTNATSINPNTIRNTMALFNRGVSKKRTLFNWGTFGKGTDEEFLANANEQLNGETETPEVTTETPEVEPTIISPITNIPSITPLAVKVSDTVKKGTNFIDKNKLIFIAGSVILIFFTIKNKK